MAPDLEGEKVANSRTLDQPGRYSTRPDANAHDIVAVLVAAAGLNHWDATKYLVAEGHPKVLKQYLRLLPVR